ncbi:MAG: MBL fold metallo-hydrolase [Caldithrix sp.]|nr:MBL fold metallo-hydrolase [Caldithrix sp.]
MKICSNRQKLIVKSMTLWVFFIASPVSAFGIGAVDSMNNQNITITVVYDNNTVNNNIGTAWGFSCTIQTSEETILFDTGGEGSLLMENMQKLNIEPQEIDAMFLSHIHHDHTGGIHSFLNQHPAVTVYMPQSFPRSFKQKISDYGANVISISECTKLSEQLFSTGEMGRSIIEQSLIVQSSKGLMIITGCAHPGIIYILSRIKKSFDDPLFLVLGGFHLVQMGNEDIRNMISELSDMGVRYVAPCHCSGEDARRLCREAYNEHYIEIGAGSILETQNLP